MRFHILSLVLFGFAFVGGVPKFGFAETAPIYRCRNHIVEPSQKVSASARGRSAELSEIYAKFTGPIDSDEAHHSLGIICMREKDQAKAFAAVTSFLKRPVDWKALRWDLDWYWTWQDRYGAIGVLEHLSLKQSRDFLVKLLDADESRKLVLECAGPKSDWVSVPAGMYGREEMEVTGLRADQLWVEDCARSLQIGAAYASLMTDDESMFEHVENAYKAARLRSKRTGNIMDESRASQLRHELGKYLYFKKTQSDESLDCLCNYANLAFSGVFESYYPVPEED